MLVQRRSMRRQIAGLRPFRAGAQRLRRLDGQLFTFRRHRKITAVTHDGDNAGHRTHGSFVAAFELRTRRRRSHDASEHHARHADVLHVRSTAGHLLRNIAALDRFADDTMTCDRLGLRTRGCFAFEIRFSGEVPVRDLRAACTDGAVFDHQLVGSNAELRRGSLHEQCARFGECGRIVRLTRDRHGEVIIRPARGESSRRRARP